MSDVEGKVAIIIGASRGLGAQTARELARRGARVVLGARNAEQLDALVTELRREGHTADYRQANVIRIEEMRHLAQFAAAKYGRIDVLVNGAGIQPSSSIDELDIDQWNRTIDVNLRGTLHGIAAVLPYFRRQGAGHIVNICSSALGGDRPYTTVFDGTQFAIRGITESLRREIGTDIRVTLIDTAHRQHSTARASGGLSPSVAIARKIASAIERPYELHLTKIAVNSPMMDPSGCC